MISKVFSLHPVLHTAAAGGSILGFFAVKSVLDASYAASRHPVDYFTGQTAFNADTIKGYYNTMIDAGTLDIYVQTQIIDYGFMLMMACIGTFVITLFARLGRANGWGRKIGIFAATCAVAGAVSDAIENGISFAMLANPLDFAPWLAVVYSSFAALKFGLITCGLLAFGISILCVVVGRLITRS